MRLSSIKNRLLIGLISLSTLISILSCKSKDIEITRTILSMGTFVQIEIVCNNAFKTKANNVIDKSFQKINSFDRIFDYRKNGQLHEFNNSTILKKDESPELYKLIVKSIKIAKMTDGAFDPTIYPLIRLWGFNGNHPSLPSFNKIKETIDKINYKKIKILNNKIIKPADTKFDLSGIAKGRIVDLISKYIKSEGFTNFLINAGGDIYVSGLNNKNTKWKIAIQDPFNPDKYSGILNITNSAIVTSGDYENFFIYNNKRYCHILNPKTGYPPFNMHSVTIISDNTTFSDAIATAVFVMEPLKGYKFLKTNKIRGLIIYTNKDNKIVYKATKNFWE